MGYPEGHKEKTRQRIVEAARKLWKSKGFSGASVDKVMEEAGLTRGGFYAHFKSKDDLLLAVLNEAKLSDGLSLLKSQGVGDRQKQIAFVLDWYLGLEHKNRPEDGCPLTALTQEIPRIGEAPKEKIDEMVAGFASWLSQGDQNENGYAALSMMVGAMTLARACHDEEISKKLLSQTRNVLDELFFKG